MVDVAIVGAGISGLSAAYELQKRGLTMCVLESRDRIGGVILTERVDDFVVDAGPDSLLVQKPAALEMCRELGLADRLVSTTRPRTAYIYRGGRLHPIPEASILGFPTQIRSLAISSLFTMRAKIRMSREVFMQRRASDEDESIASFVRRHFGPEAVDYIAEPLLAGIHAGDVERLSIRATFPTLVDAETRHGSIVRAFMRRPVQTDGAFRSLPGGIAELAHALVSRLRQDTLLLRHNICAVEVSGDGVRLHQADHPPVTARAGILAAPAWSVGRLLKPVDESVAKLCDAIPYWSTVTIGLAYRREAVAHPMEGTGFVVPRKEGLTITAATWSSSKWPHRAPAGCVLLRAFLGGARDPDAITRSDDELVAAAIGDLAPVLGIRGEPVFTRVYRWYRASPQQEVGHLQLMNDIDARLTRHGRLGVTGTGFRGVGIPDCIADARATAVALAERLRSFR